MLYQGTLAQHASPESRDMAVSFPDTPAHLVDLTTPLTTFGCSFGGIRRQLRAKYVLSSLSPCDKWELLSASLYSIASIATPTFLSIACNGSMYTEFRRPKAPLFRNRTCPTWSFWLLPLGRARTSHKTPTAHGELMFFVTDAGCPKVVRQ